MSLVIARVAALLLLTVAVGCGGGSGQHDTASVTGTVTCNGTPLTEGVVSFTPVAAPGESSPGKPATATIGPDGEYTLSTYSGNDGAVLGKHEVTVMPLGDDDDGPVVPLPCKPRENIQVEVFNESNTIDIELADK